MAFSIDDKEISSLLGGRHTEAGAVRAIDKETLTISDFSALVTCDGGAEFMERLAAKAKSLTGMRFGRVKGLYIPLYLSSSCHNVCTYCGFSQKNRVKRKTLSAGEIANELEGIYEKGFRNILLVSGELHDFKNSQYLARAVGTAKAVGFQSIAVELGALDDKSAALLARSGAQSFVLYQETYHPETYAKVHPEGQKADYPFRLGGAERAIEAGFRQVTLGFLAGLYDPLYEALCLYSHISHLKKKHWDVEFSMSIPRLRHASGAKDSFHNVSDTKYAQILMAFRLAFPEIAINLSTREAAPFRDGMANICITHLSVESKTFPGGYVEKNGNLLAQFSLAQFSLAQFSLAQFPLEQFPLEQFPLEQFPLEQFSIGDNRSLTELTETLGRMGYDFHFKDWEMELNKI